MELHYVRVYETQAGGWVDLHPLHGVDELPENLEVSQILADNGFKIELLPCLPANELGLRTIFLPDVFGNKNPDVRINGIVIGDIKSPGKENPIQKRTISNAISSAAIQKVSVAILCLKDRNYSLQDVKKGIVGAMQPDRNKSIKEIWVINKSGSLFIISRDFVFNDALYEDLNMPQKQGGRLPLSE
jgi:hypothetical protein